MLPGRQWADQLGALSFFFTMEQANRSSAHLPIAPPRVDSSKGPNRVNRAHWPTKENRQNFMHFLDFSGLWKKWPQMAPNRAGRIFFLLIQTLPTFRAERIWLLRIFILLICWTPHLWISRSPDLQISGLPGPQISKSPDFQTPPAPPPDEFSDPNLSPLPTHPGIKYVARALSAI